MPKDASKLGHRGIGFVTFASPDAVEMVSCWSCDTCKGPHCQPHHKAAFRMTAHSLTHPALLSVTLLHVMRPCNATRRPQAGSVAFFLRTLHPHILSSWAWQVMSTPHALNGQELAIDRATPKEKGPAGQSQLAARMSASQQSSGGYSGGSRC